MVDGFPLKDRKKVRKNYKYLCSYIYNYPFIKEQDRLSLYKKTSIIIIIIWSLSLGKMIDKSHRVLWYKGQLK